MKMKKNQKKNSLFTLGAVVILVVVALFIVLPANHKTNTQNTNNKTNSRVLFSTSPEYSYAYLISTPTLSSNAKAALDGFKLTIKQNADGTTTYTLNASKQGYPNSNQEYTLKKGEKLYFLERSMKDDNTTSDEDYYLADDTGIIVDSNGYVVQ